MDAAPTISIVTPTYNRDPYLEDTMRSVLDQSYPNVEYVVMDGGSTDDSVSIIKRHEHRLAHWESKKDEGQYHAINEGFAHTSGEIMGWINSDDRYVPWAFQVVADVFRTLPEVEWITSAYPILWSAGGDLLTCYHTTGGYSQRGFLRGENLDGFLGFRSFIQQESTFWRRSLWERAGGGLDLSYRLAADFELWARFFREAKLHIVEAPLAGFRVHPQQKTTNEMSAYLAEARGILTRYGARPYTKLEHFARKRVAPWLPRTLTKRLGLLCQAHIIRREYGREWTKVVEWKRA